jgi:Ca2+-binding EF-hand superfamily protein
MSEHQHRSSTNNGITRTIDNLNADELIELREAFREFDQDGDVRIH